MIHFFFWVLFAIVCVILWATTGIVCSGLFGLAVPEYAEIDNDQDLVAFTLTWPVWFVILIIVVVWRAYCELVYILRHGWWSR
jgi:hypothetical protein